MITISSLIYGVLLKLSYDKSAIPEQDINWFLNYLRSELNGDDWPSGLTLMQVGMMFVKFESIDGGVEIFEPDMISVPIKFVRGVTRTLQLLRQQKDTYDSLNINVEIAFPSLRETVVECVKWQDVPSYVLERCGSSNNDSGWYIGCQDPEHNHENPESLRVTSIYDIAVHHCNIVPFFALPPNTTVLIENDRPCVSFEGVEKPPKPGSYLSRLIEKQRAK